MSIVYHLYVALNPLGLNQVFKQHLKLPMDLNELEAMGEGDRDE